MKKRNLLYVLMALVVFAGCKNYDTIRYSRANVFKKKPVAERITEYDIFVHDDAGNTYRINEPEIVEGNLIGKPVQIADSTIKGDSLNDMHLYMNEAEVVNVTTEEKQEFTNENVRYVNMSGKSKSKKNAAAFGTLLVFLIIPVVLIVGLVIAISNSGGSNSGSSNSGSPNSGESNSGCYIATMSYGSYDAPQVLVLREFRDRFLQKFGAGRAFIAWYYKNSPSFVQKHKNKKWLHAVLRLPLNAFVFVLTPIYSGRNAEK